VLGLATTVGLFEDGDILLGMDLVNLKGASDPFVMT
jgi:hypothetical protein